MLTETAPIQVQRLEHRYGQRVALRDVSFAVSAGHVFALLGPNGGGKTTLFRILTTSMRASGGQARICGHEVGSDTAAIRRLIGVVFQHASLDGKLSVRENLLHQGHLYGLAGRELRGRIAEMLQRFDIAERADDRVETLSGGLARRVDLVKGLLHRPRVLLLDEPSTGLDPQARWNFWQHLDATRRADGLTVLMTTHFMDEAQRCDRVGIIDAGRLVALGAPDELKGSLAGDCLHLEADDAPGLAGRISQRFPALKPALVEGTLRIERPRAHELIPELVNAFPDEITSVSLSKPSLEEVFIQRTGHRFEVGN